MLNIGKCPKCDRTINNVKIEDIEINFAFEPRWKGVSFLCPFCDAVLSVGIDPIAIKTDIVNEISAKKNQGR